MTSAVSDDPAPARWWCGAVFRLETRTPDALIVMRPGAPKGLLERPVWRAAPGHPRRQVGTVTGLWAQFDRSGDLELHAEGPADPELARMLMASPRAVRADFTGAVQLQRGTDGQTSIVITDWTLSGLAVLEHATSHGPCIWLDDSYEPAPASADTETMTLPTL